MTHQGDSLTKRWSTSLKAMRKSFSETVVATQGQASDRHEPNRRQPSWESIRSPARRANAASIDPAPKPLYTRPYPKVWLTQPWHGVIPR